MKHFKDKTVLITGASDGIGRALALELATDGPRLALAARSEEGLAEVAARCRALGAKTLIVPTDVTVAAACQRFVARSHEYFGAIDVLVNNAGIVMSARFEESTTFTAFHRVMDVNFFGTLYMTAAALPYLKASRGLIVGVSSVAGLVGVPERSGYCASKHAMTGFLNALRIELLGTGVDITVVAPDFVSSGIYQRAIGANAQPFDHSVIEDEKIMSSEKCAMLIRRAMAKRQRLLMTSTRGKIARLLQLFSPSTVDAIAAKAMRQGR